MAVAEAPVSGAEKRLFGIGLARVWTQAGKGMLKPHDIKIGGSNGRFTVVLSGDIKPGDQVVTDSKAPGAP